MEIDAKVCPCVTRSGASGRQVLAFSHPTAGLQLVKGGLKPGESPAAAARRELWEESGLRLGSGLRFLCTAQITGPWHLFHGVGQDLPDCWSHQTTDDHGHRFAFFWQPLDQPLDGRWHPMFHRAMAALRLALAQSMPRPGTTS